MYVCMYVEAGYIYVSRWWFTNWRDAGRMAPREREDVRETTREQDVRETTRGEDTLCHLARAPGEPWGWGGGEWGGGGRWMGPRGQWGPRDVAIIRRRNRSLFLL